MKPRSRSEPAFIDIAFSIAALPARISSGVGGVQIGCHHVIAIPHWAIAHFGSRSATEVKTREAKPRHERNQIGRQARTLSGKSPFRRRANRRVRERERLRIRRGLRRKNYWPVQQEKLGGASTIEPCSRLAA